LVYLLPVEVEHGLGRQVGGDLPGAVPGFELDPLAATTARNQNRSTSRARCRTSPRHVQPEGRTGRRRGFLGKVLQDPEYVIALVGQGCEQRPALVGHCVVTRILRVDACGDGRCMRVLYGF